MKRRLEIQRRKYEQRGQQENPNWQRQFKIQRHPIIQRDRYRYFASNITNPKTLEIKFNYFRKFVLYGQNVRLQAVCNLPYVRHHADCEYCIDDNRTLSKDNISRNNRKYFIFNFK